MNCPACTHPMTAESFGQVVVDVCEAGCGGLWFDVGELARLDQPGEGFGPALTRALAQPLNIDVRTQLTCPRCATPMHEHRYKHSRHVLIDECYGCGGVFLDSGELGLIRHTFRDHEEREEVVATLLGTIPTEVDGVFDDTARQARESGLAHLCRSLLAR